jgi:hypothetical protein
VHLQSNQIAGKVQNTGEGTLVFSFAAHIGGIRVSVLGNVGVATCAAAAAAAAAASTATTLCHTRRNSIKRP